MKRSKKLQLAIMGTAPFVLSGCTDSAREALVYKDVASCISDGVISDSVCRYEYNKAWQNHLMMAPKYNAVSDCQQDFGTTCQQLASGEYIPTMEGFMLAAEPGSSRSSFTVIPLYLGSGGFFRTGNYDRVGSSYQQGKVIVDKKATAKPSLTKPSIKSTTMKRGGFGSRSAARGSWGGIMLRITSAPRKDWTRLAESLGFKFHTIGGEAYWDETAYYQFTMNQVEQDIEDPTAEIHQMCLHLVDQAVNSEQLMERLRIPRFFWDYVRDSWLRRDSHLYGRMDFSYDGQSPAKFYEYNADTPTSLYESAFFQWLWLEQMVEEKKLPPDIDQFNIIQEMLIEALVLLKKQKMAGEPLYFSCSQDSEEDYGTVEYFRDCAVQAGLGTQFIYTEDIGISPEGQFTDLEDRTIPGMFKLYPWEFMFEEAFGSYLPGSDTLFFEPPWKAILSNKAILPLLWQEFKGHPNLLPCYFEDEKPGDDLGSHYVKKPVFSREGANIAVMDNGKTTVTVDGPYVDSGYVLQKYQPLPVFAGNHTLIGSWVIADRPAGIGIREDNSVITRDSSRFVPHVIRE